MPIELDPTGRSPLPPSERIDQPQIRAAVEALEAARQAAAAAARDAIELEHARPQASAKDREAYADAIQAGKKDPGTPNADKHDEQIAAARRKADAHRLVEERKFGELRDAIAKHEQDWLERIEKTLATARAEWLATIEKVTAVHEDLSGALALERFVRYGGRYRPTVPTQIELPRNSESKTPAADVLAALRQLGSAADPLTSPYEGGMRLVDAA